MLVFLTTFENEVAAKSTADDEMLKSIANGDMEAFRKLYELASGSIYGFALSIVKNPHDAEDVLQDTLLAVYNSAAQYKPMGKPMAWIFTIARNFALMKLRNVQRTDTMEHLQLEDSCAFSQITAVEDRMLAGALFDMLDSEERQIVMLHAVSGMKNREIAALLELPLGTVLSKYYRAMKKLRAAAEKEDIFHEKHK